jgi:diketogulonate reductase-like aldo/keto reductase
MITHPPHQLGLKELDMYLIHHPAFVLLDDLEWAWKAFEKIKDDGLSRWRDARGFLLQY